MRNAARGKAKKLTWRVFQMTRAADRVKLQIMQTPPRPLWETIGQLYRFHPWHGLKVHPEFPAKTTVYVEIVPSDTMKFELDKVSGILKIDRPQRFSNRCPAP